MLRRTHRGSHGGSPVIVIILPSWFTFLWTLTQPTPERNASFITVAVTFYSHLFSLFAWSRYKPLLYCYSAQRKAEFRQHKCSLTSKAMHLTAAWSSSYILCVHEGRSVSLCGILNQPTCISVSAVLWSALRLQHESYQEPSTRQRTNQVQFFSYLKDLAFCVQHLAKQPHLHFWLLWERNSSGGGEHEFSTAATLHDSY